MGWKDKFKKFAFNTPEPEEKVNLDDITIKDDVQECIELPDVQGRESKDVKLVIDNALVSLNQDKYSFANFIESVTGLTAISDEKTRFETAFGIIKSTGVTFDTLLETAQQRINCVNSTKDHFLEEQDIAFKEDVTDNQTLANDIQKIIQDKVTLMSEIEKEVSDLLSNKNAAVKKSKAAEKEINTQRADIQVTATSVITGINKNIDKLNKYLGKGDNNGRKQEELLE